MGEESHDGRIACADLVTSQYLARDWQTNPGRSVLQKRFSTVKEEPLRWRLFTLRGSCSRWPSTVKAARRVTYDIQFSVMHVEGRGERLKCINRKKEGRIKTFASQVEGAKSVGILVHVARGVVFIVAGTVGHVEVGRSTQRRVGDVKGRKGARITGAVSADRVGPFVERLILVGRRRIAARPADLR